MQRVRSAFQAGVALLVLSPALARASVVGDVFQEGYYAPSATTQFCSSGIFLAGASPVTDCTGEFNFSFENNKLIMTYLVDEAWSDASYSGPEFLDLSQSLAGYTATLDPSSTQPTAEQTRLSISGSTLYVDWAGELETAGDTVVIDLSERAATVTPEPASLALLGTGLLGVVGVVRKRFA